MATFGKTDKGGTPANWAGNIQQCCRYQLTEDGDISKLTAYIYCAVVGTKIKCAIYDDNAGAPNILKASTAEYTVPGGGVDAWVDFTISGGVELSAAYYWLAWWHSAAFTLYYDTGVSNQRSYDSKTYNSWRDPFDPDGYSTEAFSIYATYTPSVGAVASKRLLIGVGR